MVELLCPISFLEIQENRKVDGHGVLSVQLAFYDRKQEI